MDSFVSMFVTHDSMDRGLGAAENWLLEYAAAMTLRFQVSNSTRKQ